MGLNDTDVRMNLSGVPEQYTVLYVLLRDRERNVNRHILSVKTNKLASVATCSSSFKSDCWFVRGAEALSKNTVLCADIVPQPSEIGSLKLLEWTRLSYSIEKSCECDFILIIHVSIMWYPPGTNIRMELTYVLERYIYSCLSESLNVDT